MDPHLIGYPLLATRMGVVVVEQTDESDQWYEDFQCWLSSGEKGPQASPVAPQPSPVTPQPSPVTPHHNPVTPHHNPVTPHHSPVTPHHNPVTPQPNPVTPHHSPVTPQPNPVTPQPSPVTPQPSPVTPQPNPVTPQPSPVTPQPNPVSSEGDEPGHGRKVSFFDDVTVYMFDQESPTRELQSHWPETNSKETKGQSPIPIYRHTPETNDQSPIPPCSYVNHLPHMATSGVSLEDNGPGLEWEDDFSFLDSSLKTKMADHHLIISESSISSAPPHQTSTSSHQRWSCPSTHACSQLRPSSLVLTHVTDADLEQ